MNKPSSTITAAFIASQVVVVLWAAVETYTAVEVSPILTAESAALAGAICGYFKRENVLDVRR